MKNITPDLCDCYPDQLEIVEPGFKSYGQVQSFYGMITTVKCFEDNSCVKQLTQLTGKGKVIVVDAGASMRRACLGDNLALQAKNNGWQGIVIYGCIRDTDILADIPFGIQALGATPMKTEQKGVGEIDIPVTFKGVTFRPGSFLYADNSGIVVSATALDIPNS